MNNSEEPKEYFKPVLIDNNIIAFLIVDEKMGREEAKKTLEKLKAFKRLKDKGFKFVGVRPIGKVIDFDMPRSYHCAVFNNYEANEDQKEFYDDLMLLFGGKDD